MKIFNSVNTPSAIEIFTPVSPLKITTASVQKLLFPAKAVALLLIFLFSVSIARALTKTWISTNVGSGFDWTDGTNWVGGVAPVNGDDIVFNTNYNGDVIFSKMPDNASYNSLTISGYITFANDVPTTLTIGGDNTNPDFFIKGYRQLTLSSNITITLNIGSTATIDGTFIIRNLSEYNTGSSSAVTTVNGLIDNRGGTVTSPLMSNLKFNSNSTYQHWREGGSLPIAEWHSTSTCNIQFSGIVEFNAQGPAPSSFEQEFGNLIWNCDQNRTPMSFAPYLKTVKGNLEIKQTGSNEYYTQNTLLLTNSGTGTLTISGTLKIGGHVFIEGSVVNAGSTFIYRNARYKSAVLTVSSGTLNVSSLTVGPHYDYGYENPIYFNPLTIFKIESGTVNINADLTIYSSCYFTCVNAPAVNIKGNLTNNGNYNKASETVTFNGSAAQYIQGTSITTFNNLTINNALGVSLQSDAKVSNTLDFSAGKLTTGTKTMTLDALANPITGAGAGKYVNGKLKINIKAGTTSKIFEIGDATNYTPITLNFTGTATNGTGNIVAQSTGIFHPNAEATSNIDMNKSVNRYWTLTNNGVSFGSYNAVFTFIDSNPVDLDAGANPLNFIVQRFVPSTWYSTNIGTRTSTTIEITGGTQSQFGDFQAGEQNCVVPADFTVTGGGSYCLTSPAYFPVDLSDSEAGVNYQLKIDGVNSGEPVAGTDLPLSFGSFTAAGTYTVLATKLLGGCSVTMNGSAVITIISAPTLTAGNNGPVCSGTTLSLTASDIANATYTWSGPNFTGSVQNPIVSNSATLAMNGTYTVTALVTVTDGSCSIQSSTSVTVNPSPAQTVAKEATGISFTSFNANWYSTSGASGYQLDVSPDFSFSTYLDGFNNLDVSLVTTKVVSGLTPGINNYAYRVRAYNTNCTGPDSEVITVSLPARYKTWTSGNWDNKDIWLLSYDAGNNWGLATYPPSSSDSAISIQYGNIVTVTQAVTIDQLTVEAGGTLVNNSGINFTINDGPGTDLVVNGTLISKSTIVNNGTISFSAGSLYQHIRSVVKKSPMAASEIPVATWDNNSTCEILSVFAAPSAGLNQAFGNFTWNYAGQGSAINLGGLLTQVNGNFTIAGTGGSELQLASTPTTLNVGGNTQIQSGSTLDMGTSKIIGNGNFILESGSNLKIGSPDGITTGSTGNIQVTGAFTDNGANYVYNGATNQVSGNRLPFNLHDLTIENAAGVTLSNSISCGGILDVTAGKLIVPSAYNVTVIGTTTLGSPECLVLKSDASGTASFIDNGEILGTGTARIERYLAKYDAVSDYKYHFLSSPVGDAQAILPEFSDPPNMPLTDFYKWDEPSDLWINYRGATTTSVNASFGSNFEIGKGYLVAYPTNVTKNFVGKPYTDEGVGLWIDCTNSSVNGGWNLLGNPYPSAIDWDNIVTTGYNFGLDAALYYYDNTQSNYRYYIQLTGDINSINGGTKNIPAMQGFMVHANSNLGLYLIHDFRIHEGQNTYYKNSSPLTSNILNLKVEGNSYSDESRVCFYDQATVSFDGKYDAYKLFSYNAKVPQLYSVTPDQTQLAINTLPEDDMYGDVPLGFKVGVSGTYLLTADGIGSFPSTMYIKLEDRKTGLVQKLNDNPKYTFTAGSDDDANRFVLHFQDATSVDKPEKTTDFSVIVDNGVIHVTTFITTSGQVNIIDMSGRKVGMAKLVSGSPASINMQGHSGVYIVNIVTNKGVANEKVVVR